MLDFDLWTLDFWILDSGLSFWEFRSRLPQGLDFGLMDFAFSALELGLWVSDSGF